MYDKEDNGFSQTDGLSYILIIIFGIIEILSVVGFTVFMVLYEISIEEAILPIDKVNTDIFFIVIMNVLIYTIPVIVTIMQYFCNKQFFKVQLLAICITMFLENIYYISDLFENLPTVIKNLFFLK